MRRANGSISARNIYNRTVQHLNNNNNNKKNDGSTTTTYICDDSAIEEEEKPGGDRNLWEETIECIE